jgi:hypothetical protein
VFEEGTTPNDTDEPIATGPVAQDSTEAYVYLIEDLVADTYTAAFTCTGTTFAPVDGKEAVIAIGEDTPLPFVAEDAP